MTTLTFCILLHASAVTAAPQDYSSAYKSAHQSGKPLVVLVTADWCPACQTMKKSAIPQVQSEGALQQVSYTVVNTDRDSQLAGKLMQGGSIPQLVMYHQTSQGWKRSQLIGAQSPSAIRAFLSQAAHPARALARLTGR